MCIICILPIALIGAIDAAVQQPATAAVFRWRLGIMRL
jgi:hypothetical protein